MLLLMQIVALSNKFAPMETEEVQTMLMRDLMESSKQFL
jgi:hypothetical protein